MLVGFENVGVNEAAAMIWRLKADGGSGPVNGALDPSFGTGGRVALKPDTANVANAVLVQPDGKIDVTGYIFNVPAGKSTVAVWRLTESGGPDTSFDTDGFAEISDTNEDSGVAIALAPGGKIVIAGTTTGASNPPDAVVWRLKPDGGTGKANDALDTTFDTDGQADIDSGGEDEPGGVVVQPDGRIVVAGRSNIGKTARAMVWRLKLNGGSGLTNNGLDPTFDTDGVAELDGGGFANASAMTLQPDGKMLVAGSAQAGAAPGAAVLWRLTANGGTGAVNGALDPTFGTGGVASVNAGAGAAANALALEPNRRIVVAGPTVSENLLVFRALGDPFTLTLTSAGTGSGTVQSSPAGIACGAACAAPFDDGASVTLTAAPAAGSVLAGWSGGGCTAVATCAVTMNASQNVTATFNAIQPSAPKITALTESDSTFAVGPASTPLSGRTAAKRHRRGTIFSFRLDQAATVRIVIKRQAPGRRVGHRCRAAARKLRGKPRCTRSITVVTLTRLAHAGLNRFSFSGRLRGRALAVGRYRAVFIAVDSAGASAARALGFTVVRR